MSTLYTKDDYKRVSPTPLRENLRHEPYRSVFRRDYARVIHSPSFRRLQGKTQVFPAGESDFFRNRLTHSLEVAQIAKSIAIRLNWKNDYFLQNKIDTDLTELAGLAHDLGHPPFGHNGERALDDCMKEVGGFEGNAQTFHIVAKAEKKELMNDDIDPIDKSGKDKRTGLNWCFRSLASVLKYDHIIPVYRKEDARLEKGIYESDRDIFEIVKRHVAPNRSDERQFKTIECSIMDVADDIAYSTYDLEDILKAGFQTPLDILSARDDLLATVAEKVAIGTGSPFEKEDVLAVLDDLFQGLQLPHSASKLSDEDLLAAAADIHFASSQLSSNGYLRTKFTSDLISEALAGIRVHIDKIIPSQSSIRLQKRKRIKVETLKHFAYVSTIMSSRLRVPEQRGYDIIRRLFEKLDSRTGHLLLPSDFRELYNQFPGEAEKKRVVCDFIAGMTDRYAVEFYGRIFSENPQSIFKPL